MTDPGYVRPSFDCLKQIESHFSDNLYDFLAQNCPFYSPHSDKPYLLCFLELSSIFKILDPTLDSVILCPYVNCIYSLIKCDPRLSTLALNAFRRRFAFQNVGIRVPLVVKATPGNIIGNDEFQINHKVHSKRNQEVEIDPK